MSKRERRFLESEVKLETREATQSKITGYAAKFGVRSVSLGNFVEQISPSTFNDFLANPSIDTVALFNHDENLPLGRRSAGNLKIGVDDTGLWYEISPIPDTSYARDLTENLRMGIVRSSSFAFFADDEEWSKDNTTGQNVRTIKAARLIDVSPVVNPAYPDATSQLRSMFPDGVPSVPEADEESIRRFQRYMQLRVMSLTPRRIR